MPEGARWCQGGVDLGLSGNESASLERTTAGDGTRTAAGAATGAAVGAGAGTGAGVCTSIGPMMAAAAARDDDKPARLTNRSSSCSSPWVVLVGLASKSMSRIAASDRSTISMVTVTVAMWCAAPLAWLACAVMMAMNWPRCAVVTAVSATTRCRIVLGVGKPARGARAIAAAGSSDGSPT